MASEDTPADQPRASLHDAWEKKRMYGEIFAIARELARPVPEIADLYVDMYARLKARAKVTDYLPILAARKVRAYYRSAPTINPSMN